MLCFGFITGGTAGALVGEPGVFLAALFSVVLFVAGAFLFPCAGGVGGFPFAFEVAGGGARSLIGDGFGDAARKAVGDGILIVSISARRCLYTSVPLLPNAANVELYI